MPFALRHNRVSTANPVAIDAYRAVVGYGVRSKGAGADSCDGFVDQAQDHGIHAVRSRAC
jgi:hypothetical protein